MGVYYYLKATVEDNEMSLKFYNDIDCDEACEHDCCLCVEHIFKRSKYAYFTTKCKICIGKFSFDEYIKGLNDLIKFLRLFSLFIDIENDIDEFNDKVMKRLEELGYRE